MVGTKLILSPAKPVQFPTASWPSFVLPGILRKIRSFLAGQLGF
jgi:hypothetical protein